MTTKQKINEILSSDYNRNGKYNLLCHLSEWLEKKKRYNEMNQVNAAIEQVN